MTDRFFTKLTLVCLLFVSISNLLNAQNCTLTAASCNSCTRCENSFEADLTEGVSINTASQFGVDFGLGLTQIPIGNYNAGPNSGTLIIPTGTTNVFSTSGVRDLPLPDNITSFCYTADINIISGSNFSIQFRIENGFGDPGSGFPALQTVQPVDGLGMCTIGGNWTLDPADTDDFMNLNGFSFTPNPAPTSNAFVLVLSVVDFSNNPVVNDIEVELSNIQFSYCTPGPDPNCVECTPNVPIFNENAPTIRN